VSAPIHVEVAEENQRLAANAIVSLYQLDLTALGGEILRFTTGTLGGAAVEFDGEPYAPADVEADGFEFGSGGALPRPRLRVSNAANAVSSVIAEFADLVGATFRRIRTFRRFLDGQVDADPTATFPAEVYVIDRKVAHNAVYVEWELATPLDAEGVMLPRRQVIREVCTHSYRVWDPDTADYDYTRVTCPYADPPAFNEAGLVVIPEQDRCGRRLVDCRLRFGQHGVLPTRKFPGAGRFR